MILLSNNDTNYILIIIMLTEIKISFIRLMDKCVIREWDVKKHKMFPQKIS